MRVSKHASRFCNNCLIAHYCAAIHVRVMFYDDFSGHGGVAGNLRPAFQPNVAAHVRVVEHLTARTNINAVFDDSGTCNPAFAVFVASGRDASAAVFKIVFYFALFSGLDRLYISFQLHNWRFCYQICFSRSRHSQPMGSTRRRGALVIRLFSAVFTVVICCDRLRRKSSFVRSSLASTPATRSLA